MYFKMTNVLVKENFYVSISHNHFKRSRSLDNSNHIFFVDLCAFCFTPEQPLKNMKIASQHLPLIKFASIHSKIRLGRIYLWTKKKKKNRLLPLGHRGKGTLVAPIGNIVRRFSWVMDCEVTFIICTWGGLELAHLTVQDKLLIWKWENNNYNYVVYKC